MRDRVEQTELLELLRQVRDGARTPEEALADARLQPDMLVGNYADIDLHRNARQGMPEVIYGEGKTAEQIAGILLAMCEKGVQNILTTRLSPEKAQRVAKLLGLAQPEPLRAAAGGRSGTPGGTAGAESGTPGSAAGGEPGTPGSTAGAESGTPGSAARGEPGTTGTFGSAAASENRAIGTAGITAQTESGTHGTTSHTAQTESGTPGSRLGIARRNSDGSETHNSAVEEASEAGQETSASDARAAGCTFFYDPVSRIAVANRTALALNGKVAVVAAGTSDLPVAEEAALTAEYCGSRVERIYDVGVAGLHRLLHRLPVLEDANVIVAVAGMEGALVSVIGGLVACPVIGVPTSVGYGANFGGAAALLSMLNSCASGVSVVNIDNGFGAGVLAARINRQSVRK